jgi:hypothetical protein
MVTVDVEVEGKQHWSTYCGTECSVIHSWVLLLVQLLDRCVITVKQIMMCLFNWSTYFLYVCIYHSF